MITSKNFTKGIRLKPTSTSIETKEGAIQVDASSSKFQAYLGAALREVLTADQIQSLSNKTIDADLNTISNLEVVNLKSGVLNTSTSLAGASDSQVPSALAIKTYVDNSSSGSAGAVQANLDAHINDTTDAHDASAISFIPDSVAVSNNVQDAIYDVVGALSLKTDLTEFEGHVDATSGAHAASAISVIPSGNLSANDVQGALSELQTDVDTRATSAALTAHTGASTGVHGVSGAIVGTTDTQTLTNKTITGADFRTPTRSDVKQDTLANLTTYALTASNGQLAFATDTKQMFQVLDSALVSVGSSAGGFDSFVNLDASEQLSNWSTGNNSTYLGGGSLAGTFTKETSAPLNGSASYKFTQASGSLNDYLASPVQSVPVRFRGNQATILFPYIYDGGTSDIAAVVWDVTNGAKLTDDTVNLVPNNGTQSSMYKANVYIPSTCTQIRVGFQVKVANSGKVFQFDDVQVTSDTSKFISLAQAQSSVYSGTNTNATATLNTSSGNGIYTISAGVLTALKECFVSTTLSMGCTASTNDQVQIISSGTAFSRSYNRSNTANALSLSASLNLRMLPGDTLTYSTSSNAGATSSTLSVVATAYNTNIVQQVDTVSSDTIQFQYANAATYTLATLNTAPVGTYITFTYAANTNTRTQTTGTNRPSQTDADMNVNGIQLFTRSYNNISSFQNPAVVAIQIGKGFKACNLELFKSTGKTTAGDLNYKYNAGTVSYGMYIKGYDSNTGILVLDSGSQVSSGVTSANFSFLDVSSSTNGYLTFTASKNPALVGLNIDNVGASYNSNAGQAIGTSFTLLNFEDKIDDSNSAYSSGIYTVPETGSYQINATFAANATWASAGSSYAGIAIYVQGVSFIENYQFANAAANRTIVVPIGTRVRLVKGQTVSIYGLTTQATTMSTISLYNNFSINKVS